MQRWRPPVSLQGKEAAPDDAGDSMACFPLAVPFAGLGGVSPSCLSAWGPEVAADLTAAAKPRLAGLLLLLGVDAALPREGKFSSFSSGASCVQMQVIERGPHGLCTKQAVNQPYDNKLYNVRLQHITIR